jgi:hypothetical protein
MDCMGRDSSEALPGARDPGHRGDGLVGHADEDPRPAFAGFRVTTLRKPDGRRVHYYDWPDRAGPRDDERPTVERNAAAGTGGDV